MNGWFTIVKGVEDLHIWSRSKEELTSGMGVTPFGDEQGGGGGDIGCDNIADNQMKVET